MVVHLTLRAYLPSAFAFFQASILPSDGMLEPHRQWRLILLVSSLDHSLDQRLVGQSLAASAINKTIQPRQGMVLDVAFVQPEREFINITAKMLAAGVMVDTDQTALENGEDAFNSVRGNGTAHIFTGAVIDRFVPKGTGFDPVICPGFVCIEHRTGFDALRDRVLDSGFVGVGDRNRNRPAPALAHTKNSRLADSSASCLQLLGFVLVLFNPADKGFVDFDDAFELGEVRTSARLSEPMQDEPSRLLGDPDFLRQLHAGYALARRHKQVHRVNPLMQGNVASLEYRSGASLILSSIGTSPAVDKQFG